MPLVTTHPQLTSVKNQGGFLMEEWGERQVYYFHKHDHYTRLREIERHVRALARNHPEGWKGFRVEGLGSSM